MPITQTHKKCDNNNKDDGEVAVASSKATAIVMATATNKEKEDGNGKKPSPHLDAHEQVGGVSGSSSIMRNPYLPHHFQAYSYSPFLSSDGQLFDCSPLRHFDPPPPKKKKQKHSNDLVRTPLPLLLPTSTYSPVRNKFGNEYYISPTRSTPAPAALHSKKDPPQLLPPPAVAAAEEAKKNTNGDGGGGDYVTVSFPTAFPKLAVKAKGKRAHRSRSDDDAATNEVTLTSWDRKFVTLTSWDRKFDELVSASCVLPTCLLPTSYFISCFVMLIIFHTIISSSLILRSSTVIVEYRSTMHQIPNLARL